MCFLIPILPRQIACWLNFVPSIQFAVGEGVEIDIEESTNLFPSFSFHRYSVRTHSVLFRAYTNAINVLRCVDLAEIDADASSAVLAEHLIFILGIEAVVATASTAVVIPSNR
jgi:hypothetical protein